MSDLNVFSKSYLQKPFKVYPTKLSEETADAIIPLSDHFELLKQIYPSLDIYYSGTPVWMQKNGIFIGSIGAEIKTYGNTESIMLLDNSVYKKIFGKSESAKDSFLILRNDNLIRKMGFKIYDYC